MEQIDFVTEFLQCSRLEEEANMNIPLYINVENQVESLI